MVIYSSFWRCVWRQKISRNTHTHARTRTQVGTSKVNVRNNDGKNTKVRWWKVDSTMVISRNNKITMVISFRVFTIVLSNFHHRGIAVSLFSTFHHRTVVLSLFRPVCVFRDGPNGLPYKILKIKYKWWSASLWVKRWYGTWW